ncbi:hypothetical protein BGZ47_011652 [Haplosporangium gracile]|nr:hypothetical protein BGZ47_011652 [Haplosporangium gracile]
MLPHKDLRVCTLNFNSFAWLRTRNDYDIIALQELAVSSTISPSRKEQWKREWKAPMAISDECAILINNNRLSIHNRQEFIQGRILSVDIAYDNDINNTIRLVNIYAPSNTNRGQAKNGQIRKTPQSDYTVMTRIDYIFVSRALLDGVSGYEVVTASIASSDHRLVSATIDPSLTSKPKEIRVKAAPSLDTRVFSDAAFRTEIRSAMLRFRRIAVRVL